MPGGRLTHDDRRHIALGLAEGLTFAEIARRLGRPTSTVSREVARGGGSGGYRAGRAHRDAARRARRGGQAPAAPAAHRRESRAVRAFEERLTAALVATGLPRMTGRVLTCLYLTAGGSLGAAELVRRLRVSPASISKAIGYLEAQGLVRRERDARSRRERYIVDDDVWLRGCEASNRIYAALTDVVREGAELFAGTAPGARLDDMRCALEQFSHDMAEASGHWRQVFEARRAADGRPGLSGGNRLRNGGDGPRNPRPRSRPVAESVADLPEVWRLPFELAGESLRAGSPPVGAVLADPAGRVVAAGRDRSMEPHAPPGQLAGTGIAHAVINVLAQLPSGRDLNRHCLYTTSEPCPMCRSALAEARVEAVVCAASDELEEAAAAAGDLPKWQQASGQMKCRRADPR